RLVLAKEKGDKPFLQGWAVVENQSDEDWKDVRMALMSGRPISFRMDLYQPLYVQRPLVEPELFASLRPVAYSGSMDNNRAVGGTTFGAAPVDAPPGKSRPTAPPAPPGVVGGGFSAGGDQDMDALKKTVRAGINGTDWAE